MGSPCEPHKWSSDVSSHVEDGIETADAFKTAVFILLVMLMMVSCGRGHAAIGTWRVGMYFVHVTRGGTAEFTGQGCSWEEIDSRTIHLECGEAGRGTLKIDKSDRDRAVVQYGLRLEMQRDTS